MRWSMRETMGLIIVPALSFLAGRYVELADGVGADCPHGNVDYRHRNRYHPT